MIDCALACLWLGWLAYRLANPPPPEPIGACVEAAGGEAWREACVSALWFRLHSLLAVALAFVTLGRLVWVCQKTKGDKIQNGRFRID